MLLRQWWNKYFPRISNRQVLRSAVVKISAIKSRLLKTSQIGRLIGLDISAHAIKLLQINTTQTPNVIENFAISALPPGAIVKEEIKNPAVIANALKNLIKQTDIKIKTVALAIPRSSAIIKNISIDKRLNTAEIEARAWMEAHRFFPDLVEEIYLDFRIVGKSAHDASQLDMIIVACRKEQLKPYLDVLQQSGLTAKIVDVNCYSLERALSLVQKNSAPLEAIALLNLNFTLSSLIVSHQEQLIYAHDHSYDGQRVMTQVRKYLNDTAENLIDPITKNPLAEDAPYQDILKENLSAHLRHTMHFFYSSRPNINIQKMIISGDCGNIPGLAKFISAETNIETELANPFVNMEMLKMTNKEDFAAYTPMLMLSCGLALSELE